MTTLHLCIATGQNAANLIPLKQLDAQEVWILETPPMRVNHSGAHLETALKPYCPKITRVDFDDSTPTAIANSAFKLVDGKLDGRDVVFHVTGGTKLMVLAINKKLELLATGSGTLRVVYANTAHQRLDWLAEEPHVEPMQDVLTLQDLLLVQGYRTTNDTRHAPAQQRAAARADVSRNMGDNAAHYRGFFSALATVANRASASTDHLVQHFDYSPGGRQGDLLELAASRGLVTWIRGDERITFIDCECAAYFAGAWLEEFVFLKLTGLFGAGQFAINAKVIHEHSQSRNEIDAMVIHRNRSLLVECKTGKQTSAEEAIYKLGQVRGQVGGIMSRGLYVSAQQVSDVHRKRAKEYGIDVLAVEDLSKISVYLRDWKGS